VPKQIHKKRKRLVTATQWARLRQISQPAASQQLRRVGIEPRDGPFDPEEADRLIEAARHLSRRKKEEASNPRGNGHAGGDDEQVILAETASFFDAQRIKEIYKARREALEYENQRNRMLDAEQVESMLFKLGRQLRDAIMNTPDRITGLIAAETGIPQPRVHAILDQECRQICEGLSREIRHGLHRRPRTPRRGARARTRAGSA
jgi:hypothetical protein